jgi:sec-independent protein translocase protein TatA
MAGLSGWHLVILLVVVVLLFGAKRLPDMARAVGQSVRVFKGEMNTTATEEHTPVPRAVPGTSPAIDQPSNPTSRPDTPPQQ